MKHLKRMQHVLKLVEEERGMVLFEDKRRTQTDSGLPAAAGVYPFLAQPGQHQVPLGSAGEVDCAECAATPGAVQKARKLLLKLEKAVEEGVAAALGLRQQVLFLDCLQHRVQQYYLNRPFIEEDLSLFFTGIILQQKIS